MNAATEDADLAITPMPENSSDSDPEISDLERAWHGMCSVYAQVSRRVAADLDANGYLDLTAYDVLFALETAGGRLRIKELLKHVTLSQPGLSRKVERLQEEGLVIREPSPLDKRVVVVVITDSGRSAVRETANLHSERVVTYLHTHLDATDRQALTAIFGRVLTRMDSRSPASHHAQSLPQDAPESA